MFRRISYTIALQFTAFVFVLFLVNGAIFLAADFGSAQRQMGSRLARSASFILNQHGPLLDSLPPDVRDRVRITDEAGNVLFQGGIYTNVPFVRRGGVSAVTVGNEQYDILTTPITINNQASGYLQVAEMDRLQLGDLPLRAALYLLVSVVISALTFLVGLFFARRSLKPAEQMVERLEQFTQDASHELRTPLAVLGSSLDVALKTHKYREGLVSAKEDLKLVAVLVERLLELARLDRFLLKAETVDMTGLVEESVEKHSALAAHKDIQIQSVVAPGITAQGDGALLRQVLGNLLSNAVKFSKPGGGLITVTLTKHSLSVADTGVGIPASSLPHIFERFYQADTSRAKGGYGLGLSLVRRIVELHGWTVTAKSDEGKGTTVTVHLTASTHHKTAPPAA